MAVVVIDVFTEHRLEVATADDQHSVETLATDGAHEALSEGVGPRCSDRGADDPDALGAEDLVEIGCELGIAIPDQEPDHVRTLGEFIGRVPSLLNLWVPRTSSTSRNQAIFMDESTDLLRPLES